MEVDTPRISNEIFEKTLTFFKNKHSKDLQRRQIAEVEHLCQIYSEGFVSFPHCYIYSLFQLINDIPDVCELLEILLYQISGGSKYSSFPFYNNDSVQTYSSCTIMVLRLCQTPFVVRKTSQLISSKKFISDILNKLCAYLNFSYQPEIVVEILLVHSLMIRIYYNLTGYQRNYQFLQRSSDIVRRSSRI
jgi:hypothetical protein